MLDFAKHLETLKDEPQWFKDERVAAWEKFSQLPMPAQSDESWRLLDLSALDLDKLTTPPHVSRQPCSLKSIDDILVCDHEHIYWGKQIKQYIASAAGIVIESPQNTWCQLNEELSRQGVICATIPEALAKHAYLIQSFLIGLTGNVQLDKFAQLNQALCYGGIFIYVPDGVAISKPLLCLNLFGPEADKLSTSRLIVLVGRNSQLSIINILSGNRKLSGNGILSGNKRTLNEDPDYDKKSNPYALVNYLAQMHMQSGAQVDYVEMQNFDDNVFVVKSTHYGLEKDSRLQSLTAAFGAGQLKDEICTDLKDRGAECTINGVILGNKNECFNFNTIDAHNAPDTKSSIDFRVALKDEAKSIYHGTIEVAKDAQKTNAFQSNKNLLLGDKAHADSIPKLEILTDDVKCSHGATVGPVDRNQLFYLMSRGLNANKAEELIVSGFFHQLIGDCKIEGMSDWLDFLVANKVENNTEATNTDKNPPIGKHPTAAALTINNKKAQPALVK